MPEERLQRLERDMDHMKSRLGSLEQSQAVTTVQFTHIEQKLDKLDDKLTDSSKEKTWFIRIVGGVLIAAVITFMLKGGLAIGV